MNFALIIEYFDGDIVTCFHDTKEEMLKDYDETRKSYGDTVVEIHCAVLYTKEEIEQLF